MKADSQNTGACDITFAEKVRFYSHDYLKCFMYLDKQESPENIFTKSFFSKLITTSHLLEDFLDFHGARKQLQLVFLPGVVCSHPPFEPWRDIPRNISATGWFFMILTPKDEFRKHGEFVLEFMTNSLMQLAPIIIEEASRVG